MTTLTLGQIAVDAAEPQRLATFYSELLGRPVADGATQYFAQLAGDDRVPTIMFLAVPEPRTAKNRVHLDFVAADFEAAGEHAVSLGASKVGEFEEYGTAWITLADPEGNVFDIGRAH
jgi:predicted enzyme related to lactoylglutathione lyase